MQSTHTQTPLIQRINLEYISLGDCPALRAIQEMGRIQALYSLRSVEIEILDFQI